MHKHHQLCKGLYRLRFGHHRGFFSFQARLLTIYVVWRMVYHVRIHRRKILVEALNQCSRSFLSWIFLDWNWQPRGPQLSRQSRSSWKIQIPLKTHLWLWLADDLFLATAFSIAMCGSVVLGWWAPVALVLVWGLSLFLRGMLAQSQIYVPNLCHRLFFEDLCHFLR